MIIRLAYFFILLSFLNYCATPSKNLSNQTRLGSDQKNQEYNYKNSTTKDATFDQIDFENTVVAAKKLHLDRGKIIDSIGYAEAAIATCEIINGQLFFYPENYYNKNKNSDKNILLGREIKLSQDDKFLLVQVDKKTNIARLDIEKNEEENVIATRQKKEMYEFLLQLNFTQSDLEKVISYIKMNLHSFQNEKEKLITMNDVYLAAANGFLSSIDPHSKVFKKEQFEKIEDANPSTYSGVGMILSGGGIKEVIVENLTENSPALNAGVFSGDVILSIDGKNIKGLSLADVIKLVKGKRESLVKFEIRRKGKQNTLSFEMKRDTITIKNVSGKILNQNLFYLKVSGFYKSFSDDTEIEISNQFKELQKEAIEKKLKIDGLILDLRNNSGGYLDLAINTIDLFVTKGLLAFTKDANRPTQDSYANIKDITDLPLAILVNSSTASGAEMVAGSLREHNRGILLGDKTFGNGSIQRLLDLPNNVDYTLKITSARFFLPSGISTQVQGLTPDILISAEEDGSFPYAFREKDKWKHLPETPKKNESTLKFKIEEIQNWVEKNGKAKLEIENRKNDAVKPDIFLFRAVDAFNGYLKTRGQN